MCAAIDDMVGKAAASDIVSPRAAVMAMTAITKDSLDPIHDGDSIPGCVHDPDEPARRPGPAAADAACGPGRDRTSAVDHRGTAAQSLRPALGEARRSGGAARDRGSGAVGGGAGGGVGSGAVAHDPAPAGRTS